MTSRNRARWAAPGGAVALALTLAACGGGGGGADTTSASISGLTTGAVATQIQSPWSLTRDKTAHGSPTWSASTTDATTNQHLSVTLLTDGKSGVNSVVCSSLGGVAQTATRFLGDCAGLTYSGADAPGARAWLARALNATTASAPRAATFGGVRFSLSSSPSKLTWILDMSVSTAT